jgi:hypothetical protein
LDVLICGEQDPDPVVGEGCAGGPEGTTIELAKQIKRPVGERLTARPAPQPGYLQPSRSPTPTRQDGRRVLRAIFGLTDEISDGDVENP